MPHLQSNAVEAMTRALRHMESVIQPPQRVKHKDSFVYRYLNKGIREAIIQKLARSISGLNAVTVLLSAGYTQEVGVIFRTLDEINEDIIFLASAETNNARTDRHTQYLDAFYSEPVFSRSEDTLDMLKPNMVPRKKIRAHTMNTLGKGINASQALTAGESISTAYSGYVHAASENIMDMYGGQPAHFHVSGMGGTPRVAACVQDAENYVYRGIIATTVAAKAFGDAPLVAALYKFMTEYESANGHPTPGKSPSEA